MNVESVEALFRAHFRRLEIVPTGEQPALAPLPDVRAVLLDIYGTLVMSACGEVGTVATSAEAVVAALASAGVAIDDEAHGRRIANAGARQLVASISQWHAQWRAQGVEHPEVDIRRVWESVIDELIAQKLLPSGARQADHERVAVHYEARVNPCWPMPGARRCLEKLRAAGRRLGIISNAQFFTPAMITALFGKSLSELGVDSGLRYYSFELGEAKPGDRLARLAAEGLRGRGIAAHQVLAIGNDMLNDVRPAHDVGFRTGLFAADARSLRWRATDPRLAGLRPDIVLTDWSQLTECLRPG